MVDYCDTGMKLVVLPLHSHTPLVPSKKWEQSCPSNVFSWLSRTFSWCYVDDLLIRDGDVPGFFRLRGWTFLDRISSFGPPRCCQLGLLGLLSLSGDFGTIAWCNAQASHSIAEAPVVRVDASWVIPWSYRILMYHIAYDLYTWYRTFIDRTKMYDISWCFYLFLYTFMYDILMYTGTPTDRQIVRLAQILRPSRALRTSTESIWPPVTEGFVVCCFFWQNMWANIGQNRTGCKY